MKAIYHYLLLFILTDMLYRLNNKSQQTYKLPTNFLLHCSFKEYYRRLIYNIVFIQNTDIHSFLSELFCKELFIFVFIQNTDIHSF